MFDRVACIVVPQMEQILSEIRLSCTDKRINEQLKNAYPGNSVNTAFTRHFDQGENFFLRLPDTFRVPQFPIHHDIRQSRPKDDYLDHLRTLVSDLSQIAPTVLGDLIYLFDPSDILRPAFYQLYEADGRTYLYLVHIDLAFRPQIHKTVIRGTNDTTAEYETNQLFMEADLIPLEEVLMEKSEVSAFRMRQSVSQTWIGETGRGYFVQGIWIDRELTKFFTKLFLPKGLRSYPYYPYTCRYRAICYSVVDLAPEGRIKWLHSFRRATDFLQPYMAEIQDALKIEQFSESLECFRKLKQLVPPEWETQHAGLRIRAYLNGLDLKEYELQDETN